MADETVHDFKSIQHKTLAEMAQEALGTPAQTESKIRDQATQHGHDVFMPEKVAVPGKNGLEIRGNGNPPSLPKGQRGRIFIFKPTGEKVTVMRENIGQAYGGEWIHEVVSRSGQKFLSSVRQLTEKLK